MHGYGVRLGHESCSRAFRREIIASTFCRAISFFSIRWARSSRQAFSLASRARFCDLSCSTRWISSSSLRVRACSSASSMGSTRAVSGCTIKDARRGCDGGVDGLAAPAGARIRSLHSRDRAVQRLVAMSTSNSPYAAFAALLASTGKPVSPAELHGLLLGRSCAGAGFEVEPWIADAGELLGGEPADNVRQALIGLQEMVKGELFGDDVTLVLLLPGDDAPLADRARALGQWCPGFLDGFGMVLGSIALSAEALE